MTIETAKTLAGNEYIHHVSKKNKDGTPMRARITSIKKWKTRPSEIEIHYKRGMYEYGTISQSELGDFEPGYGI